MSLPPLPATPSSGLPSVSSVASGAGRASPLFFARRGINLATPQSSVATNATKSSSSSGKSPNAGDRNVRRESLHLASRSSSSPKVVPATKLKKGDKLIWTKGRLLGRGAHGSVFLGLDSASGSLVAVKEIQFSPDDPQLDQRLASLQTELRVLKKLEHHNIVGYYSAARQPSSVLVFMEYVAGGSLASILEQFGRLQESLVVNFAFQILNGMQYLHSNNVVHRDIKCANVLISVEGTAKLADFGSAHIIDENTGPAQGEGGTAFWMAPEVIRMDPNVSFAADIWSFGCTVLEMLTNEVPFSHIGNAFKVMTYMASGAKDEPVEIPGFITSMLSPVAHDLVTSCLQRDPSRRPSVTALLQHDFFATLRDRPTTSESTKPMNSVSSSLPDGSDAAHVPYIPQAILAAAGVEGNTESVASSIPNSVVSKGSSEVSENAVRDHLVRQALSVVTTPEVGYRGATPADPLNSAESLRDDVGAVNPFNSISSVETISLSEISAHHANGAMSSHDVFTLMSSAMQDIVGRSRSQSALGEVPAVENDVISYVVDEDDEAEVVSPRNNAVQRQQTVVYHCCAGDESVDPRGDDAASVGSETSASYYQQTVPRRKVNRVQALLLGLTSIVAVVAIVLTIVFTLARREGD